MDEFFKIVYKESSKAFKKNEIPVGAIIVKNNKIISKAHNNRQKKHNVLGHAEINCILKAEKKIRDWRLDGCIMYVNLKPCELCQQVIKESRLDSVFYIIDNEKSNQTITNIEKTNVCEELKCDFEKQLKRFFVSLRK